MKIAVLAGGVSRERDVSLITGAMVANALSRVGEKTALVDSYLGIDLPKSGQVSDLFESGVVRDVGKIKETAPDIRQLKAPALTRGEIGKNVVAVCSEADIVFLGLHGEDGENGKIQAFFDVLGIRYTGTGYLGSALAMHKGIARTIAASADIPVPKGAVIKLGQGVSEAAAVGFPCIVKPCSGGSSIGVSIAANDRELEAALFQAFEIENEVVVERFIKGREFSVGILGEEALPAIEMIPKGEFYDYAHKYQPGYTQEICPAQVDSLVDREMQDLALAAYRALGLEVYARGEFILDEKDNLFFLEMNTLPGMTPTSLLPQEAQAVGIGYDELCKRIVSLSIRKYGNA